MVHDESGSVLEIPKEQLASPSSSMFMRCFSTKRKKTDNELVLRYDNEQCFARSLVIFLTPFAATPMLPEPLARLLEPRH